MVDGLRQLEVLVAAELGRTPLLGCLARFFFEAFQGLFTGFFATRGFDFGALATVEVFFEVGLAGAQGGKRAALQRLIDHHIGHDALGLD